MRYCYFFQDFCQWNSENYEYQKYSLWKKGVFICLFTSMGQRKNSKSYDLQILRFNSLWGLGTFSFSHACDKMKKHLSQNAVVNHFKSDYAYVTVVVMDTLTNWMEFVNRIRKTIPSFLFFYLSYTIYKKWCYQYCDPSSMQDARHIWAP